MRPTIKTVTIELDKPRTLRFDFNALAAFEDKTGLSVFEQGTLTSLSAKKARALLWAGLIHEDPELTIEQVGAMLTMQTLPSMTKTLLEAVAAQSPEPSEAPDPNPPSA